MWQTHVIYIAVRVAFQEDVPRMYCGDYQVHLVEENGAIECPPFVAEQSATFILALMDRTDCSWTAKEKQEFIICIPEMEARYMTRYMHFHHR